MYQRNNNCSSLITHTHLTSTPNNAKKSLMLNDSQWNDITRHLTRAEDPKKVKQMKDEEDYQAYLREGSQVMTQKWNNTIEKLVQKKNVDRAKVHRDKVAHGDRLYTEFREQDRKTQKELIAYAESLLRNLKAGPQQLESAYALTQVTEQQRLQREQRAESLRMEEMRNLTDGVKRIQQAEQWIQGQVDHMRRNAMRCGEYKKTLVRDIEEREKQRDTLNKKMTDEERAENEANKKQLNEILAKEMAVVEQKREQIRKNAMDSMRMARQRLLKDAEKRRTEERKIDQYLQTKRKDETLQKVNERNRKTQRARTIDALAVKVITSLPDVEGAQDKCYQTAIKKMAAQWDEQVQKRRAHTARMKEARILQHTVERDDVEQLKKEQLLKAEVEKFNQMVNEEVDCHYEVQRRRDRLNTNRELRSIITKQVEERKIREQMEITDESKYFREENLKDDQHFMDYADRLISKAREKGRVVHPLVRVVNEYKMRNAMNPPKLELPHLRSQVGIGVREKGIRLEK